ncbi:MAG TPA: hypothetical protein VEK57_05230 [Thermoanaerobaculia bacterium]|nr:hypothetical protein [Thermoanaerobaculia bacterium]
MKTNPDELSYTVIINTSRRNVDRNLRALMNKMENDNTLLAETPAARFEKVLKIYRGVRPLLALLAALPLIPSTWRSALLMFTQALEALSGVSGQITAQFKAGRDL